jgi:triacylglycerol esterase/lipase EstA (alpha/beta hydrolase family)
MRKSSVLLAALLTVIAAILFVPAARAATAERRPVLFVHGLSSFAAAWNPMIDHFVSVGYDRSQLRAFSYDWRKSNVDTAQAIRAEVDGLLQRTGAKKVDIISHSMGGLNTRWYLKFLGGTAKVDHFLSIGAPHHGAKLAALCTIFFTSCEEMRPNSEFLRQLNAGDETPGDVRYTTLWSICDEAVFSQTSAQLAGADNVNIGCVGHVVLPFAGSVHRATMTALG